jgi:hypothetical protein
MNQQEFIDAIREVTVEGSVNAVTSLLKAPPGKKPDSKYVELSSWYNNLTPADQDMISKIVSESANMGVFSFLCVLDGVSAIESVEDKGKLVLNYEKNGIITRLNGQDGEYLHDLFVE